MHLFILWVGFLGAWLLVAGPVYQASLELREEEIDRERVQAAMKDVGGPPRVSAWWWLLPPLAYLVHQRAQRDYRAAMMRALGPEERRQMVSFIDKGRGWLIVACGGFLIAVKETYELGEGSHWPLWVFWVLIVAMPVAAIVYTVVSITRSQGALAD